MSNQIIQGDALTVLKSLPDGFVQTCVTSPPYYGLRSYLPDGHTDKPLEIGLEGTPEAYIARLVEVFREVKRVLRPDGTLWLNCGDSYAGGGTHSTGRNDENAADLERRAALYQTGRVKATTTPQTRSTITINHGCKPKDLLMIPARLALALQSDGWYLRSDIIWHKPNCMPESVEDRPTTAHEHIFLLAKSERYYYDADAIREPGQEWSGQSGTFARSNGKATLLTVPGQEHVSHRINRDDRVPAGRNKRSVWTVATMPYNQAHFAVFPAKLIEPCILAGSSPRACEHCGAPWERVTEVERAEATNNHQRFGSHVKAGANRQYQVVISKNTTGWQPTCPCTQEGTGRCVVLDPFVGAGTVALVAIRHVRDWLGVELNPDYIKLAEKRIAYVQQDLWDVAGVLSLVHERLDEASDEETDEIIERLESLLEEAGA
jgi:DNA modification methylase